MRTLLYNYYFSIIIIIFSEPEGDKEESSKTITYQPESAGNSRNLMASGSVYGREGRSRGSLEVIAAKYVLTF